jgi:hypothetical protein
MVAPDPGLAPRIPPVTDPTVHVKLDEVEAANEILVADPLHISAAEEVITTGAGLTVTTITYGLPAHNPAVEVGVTRYSTVPDDKLSGFVNV